MKFNTQKCIRAITLLSICSYLFLLSAKLTNNFTETVSGNIADISANESISMVEYTENKETCLSTLLQKNDGLLYWKWRY